MSCLVNTAYGEPASAIETTVDAESVMTRPTSTSSPTKTTISAVVGTLRPKPMTAATSRPKRVGANSGAVSVS